MFELTKDFRKSAEVGRELGAYADLRFPLNVRNKQVQHAVYHKMQNRLEIVKRRLNGGYLVDVAHV